MSQNEKPSPAIAPATAAMSSPQGLIFAAVASALIAMISEEPGTTVPITGTASDSANRKTARNDSCGCAPTKSTRPAKEEFIGSLVSQAPGSARSAFEQPRTYCCVPLWETMPPGSDSALDGLIALIALQS